MPPPFSHLSGKVANGADTKEALARSRAVFKSKVPVVVPGLVSVQRERPCPHRRPSPGVQFGQFIVLFFNYNKIMIKVGQNIAKLAGTSRERFESEERTGWVQVF